MEAQFKKLLTVFLLTSFATISYSQCSITDILPFKTGETKFENITIENINGIHKDNELYHENLTPEEQMQKWTAEQRASYERIPEVQKKQFLNNLQVVYNSTNNKKHPEYEEWIKPSYLKNDSIYKIRRFLKWDNMPCFNNKSGHVSLNFADDTLYSIRLLIYYNVEEFSSMQNIYIRLIDNMKLKYIPEKTVIHDNIKNEQIGEGYFFRTYKGFRKKVELYDISYEFNSVGNYYYLQIEYSNTKCTKFNNGSYD